ncbi:DUF4092 domain-containing protein [Vibrio chagasii]|nr:DUF4092 domain-containing protein [Vibrio chagasii]
MVFHSLQQAIGKGKAVFMGNGLYPSILSCPENYWANRALHISIAQTTVHCFDVRKPTVR